MKKIRLPVQILGAMFKFTCFHLFLAILTLSVSMAGNTYSQNALTRSVNLRVDNKDFRTALAAIEEKTKVKFSYDVAIVPDEKVTFSADGESLTEVLEGLLSPLDLKYAVSGKYIIITRPGFDSYADMQGREVSGRVTDQAGQSLPGVSILVKGTLQGTVTDVDGAFVLTVPDENAVLVVSYVGYLSQEVVVANRSMIDVVLAVDEKVLDEVVVVGYGTQKKVNLTGSVATVQSSELSKRHVPNVASMLQGKVTGLEIIQNSGQPGSEGASMAIRGLGTFSSAGNAPMVLVDGVAGSLSNLNPNDIESISVLKDAASSAIYGARAANGVILVTTKKGVAGKFNVEYDYDYQVHTPTRMVDFLTNSAEYMTYYNQANTRSGLAPYFTPEEIDAYRNGSNDPARYPNFDWQDFMMNTGKAQNHNVTFSGGSDKITYNSSLGYYDQSGVIDKHDFKRLSMFLSVDSKLSKSVTIGSNVRLINRKTAQPPLVNEVVLAIYSAAPYYTPFLSDGSGRWTRQYKSEVFHNRNPLMLLDMGSQKFDDYSASVQSYIDVKISDDLVWSVKGAANFDNSFNKQHYFGMENFYFRDNSSAGIMNPASDGVTDNMNQNILTTFYSTLNYSKQIGDHHVNALAGYNQESNLYRTLQGVRLKLPNTELTELDAGPALGQSTSGTSNEWAIQSMFGRLGYNYKEKYLLEASVRYDGTSRIHKDSRWGTFPSLSAAWRLSNEEFLKRFEWIDDAKLRFSVGKLGNQNIGLYPYQDILSFTGYPFTTYQQGVLLTRLTDKTLHWESTIVQDIGVDLSFHNGLFSITADWYTKDTRDILYLLPIPMSVGLSSPTTNFASMKNSGIELEIGHRKAINDFRYSVGLNFSRNRNEVTKVKAPVYGNTTIQEGLPWNSHYLVEWIGIFQDEDEIANAPKHPFNPKPGDLRFRDFNNDGVINSEDRQVIEGQYPKFLYGLNFEVSWKNFSIGGFFQGVEGRKLYLNTFGVDPFMQGGPPTMDFISKMWTPENRSNAAPAMYRSDYTPVTGTPSTYYLQDASYFRLKNVNITYHVPSQISEKLRVRGLDLTVTGDNIFTVTDFPGSDPERAAGGRLSIYPQISMYTFGARVKF